MKKFLKWVVVAVVALVVVVVIIVGFFLGSIVKKGVETVGPQVTKVPVKLDAVHLSVLTGSATLKGLVVGNPEGYRTPTAIQVGTAAVQVDPFSVLSHKVIVKSIRIEAPVITFEGNPLGRNNLKQILDNVKAAGQSGPVATAPQTAPSAKPGKKLEVDDFLITGAKVHVLLAGIGGHEMTVDLPEIHLTDLGKGQAGLTPADLTRRVLDAVVSSTAQAVTRAAANMGKNAEAAGKSVGQQAGKTLSESVNKIRKGLGGLFRKTN